MQTSPIEKSAAPHGIALTIQRAHQHTPRVSWLVACLLGLATPVYADHYLFELRKGTELPVCKAYLERLRTTDFDRIPPCNRMQPTQVPGFDDVHTVAVPAEQVRKLYLPLMEFLRGGPVFSGFEPEARRAERQRGIDADANQLARFNSKAASPTVTRLDPKVDVDGDGVVDDVIIWRGDPTSHACGAESPRTDWPERAPVYLLAVNSQGDLDVARTRAFFGHPREPFGDINSSPKRTRPAVQREFAPIGYSFGIFSFQKKIYVDTFYSQAYGDLKGRRTDDPGLNDVLAVLRRTVDKTEVRCEIQWLSAE